MSPRRSVLVDTSVAVASVVADHSAHATTVEHLDGLRLGLAGHAWFETFSVITRLPAPLRRGPAEVSALLEHEFPESRFLSADATAALARELPAMALAGGNVYDALVAAAAREAGLHLLSRDSRAADVYARVGVDFEIIG